MQPTITPELTQKAFSLVSGNTFALSMDNLGTLFVHFEYNNNGTWCRTAARFDTNPKTCALAVELRKCRPFKVYLR